MRYAIFTDIHANLEALEAVLAKIDEIAKEKPIDQIWFLGDLVGYGPNPNECITILRTRTDVIIAGNHDWAAVGKIDLEDFSAAARVSAEWTAEQLTEEHRTFLTNLPERIEIDDCTLVHGSPYGPLWEYITSEVLAERSFQHFNSRYCVVGHTHVPIIFQQPDTFANAPTLPLGEMEHNGTEHTLSDELKNNDHETSTVATGSPTMMTVKTGAHAESAYADPETGQTVTEENANAILETQEFDSNESSLSETAASNENEIDSSPVEELDLEEKDIAQTSAIMSEDEDISDELAMQTMPIDEEKHGIDVAEYTENITPESEILNAEDRLTNEIEELLTLLGLSESMISVTNEMISPPEGHWELQEGYRAIINPGGVGQPRDGDPRAAFMIYDTEHGFEFYRIPYAFEKTQEKIIKAGLPHYLAVRLAYGR